jgi:hypothetical protein
LIDSDVDDGTTNHRATSYYDDPAHALARIEAITRFASTATRGLPCGRRHHVILTGMTALYASLDENPARAVHDRVASALGWSSAPIRWSLRLRATIRQLRRPMRVR